MQKQSGKFLLEWIDSLSRQQVFSFFWIAIAGFFLFVFWKQFQKMDTRNFREGGGTKPSSMKATGKKSTALVVSGNKKEITKS